MAPEVGLEPTTDRLTADSSTIAMLDPKIMGFQIDFKMFSGQLAHTIPYKGEHFADNFADTFPCQLVQNTSRTAFYSFHLNESF